MNNKLSPSIKKVGFVLILMLSVGFYFRCFFIGGCTFGRYKGEVTLTNKETQRPLTNATVSAYIDNGSHPLVEMGEVYKTKTDEDGSAKFFFDNVFLSPLTITFTSDYGTRSVYSIETGKFVIEEKIVKTQIERYNSSGKAGDPIELEIEISDWSLF